MTTLHFPRLGLCSLLILASLASWVASQTTQCRPGVNCRLPNCRCWDDRNIPGGLPVGDVPQVVMVTFEYAVNTATVNPYLQLFKNLKNPNNCPAVGTFFVQEEYTDMNVVKSLFDHGHEIGVTTKDGTSPSTKAGWIDALDAVRKAVMSAGVPGTSILGVRAPELKPGGMDEFVALSVDHLVYDSSCTTAGMDEGLLWPFTYDFVPGPKCDNGAGPDHPFPGKWEVLLADLEYNGTKCAAPSACPGIKTPQDASRLFYNSFIKHYRGSRSPFMMVIDPLWVTVDYKLQGTIQFLEYIRTAFKDTWILTVTDMLQWMRHPVSNAYATAGYFRPWNCP